uniref:Uncharacterized protein n=1 Tax=Ditylenchus dipsaci TaxID=166011 RepID=A0A915E1D5_9BILA
MKMKSTVVIIPARTVRAFPMQGKYANPLWKRSLCIIGGIHSKDWRTRSQSLRDNGLSSPVKESINAKDKPSRGMTARMIQQKLQLPTIKQIQNRKSYNAQKNGFSNTLSLEDLQKYYDEKKQIPVDEDQSFVVAFRHTVIIVLENGEAKAVSKFIMVILTPKLLRRQVQWPVCGFSEADKKFFPTGSAIASHEDKWCYGVFLKSIARWDPDRLYLTRLFIADGSAQITNGKQVHIINFDITLTGRHLSHLASPATFLAHVQANQG